jgi:predicted secreted protein
MFRKYISEILIGLAIVAAAIIQANRPAHAEEGYFVPVQLHYVDGDRGGVSITVEELFGNIWQLREVIPVYDDRDGYPPVAEVRVILGQASAVQQTLAGGQYGFFLRDESAPSTLNQLELYVDEVVLNF